MLRLCTHRCEYTPNLQALAPDWLSVQMLSCPSHCAAEVIKIYTHKIPHTAESKMSLLIPCTQVTMLASYLIELAQVDASQLKYSYSLQSAAALYGAMRTTGVCVRVHVCMRVCDKC